jgi:hypothetical protein
MSWCLYKSHQYDEVLSGYQPGQMVERWANQRFEDYLCPRPQGTSLTIVEKNILTKYMYTRPGLWLWLEEVLVSGHYDLRTWYQQISANQSWEYNEQVLHNLDEDSLAKSKI